MLVFYAGFVSVFWCLGVAHGALEFSSVVAWDGETGGLVKTGSGKEFRVDMPVDFGGKGRYACPDEVFLASVGGCLLTTFLFIRRKMHIHLKSLRITVRGTVEPLGPEGFRVTKIRAHMDVVVGEGEGTLGDRCAELTRDYCHISRTLEDAIKLEVSWTVEER